MRRSPDEPKNYAESDYFNLNRNPEQATEADIDTDPSTKGTPE